MCKWNLFKFAEALAPALPLEDSKAALEKYDGLFAEYYEDGMRRSVGLECAFRWGNYSYRATCLQRITTDLELRWDALQCSFMTLSR